MLIPMKVSSLTVDPFTNMPLVILKDGEGRALPIWVGLLEASAIATELEDIHLDRPIAHDLIKSILQECDVRVVGVEVRDLRRDTFYASIRLERPDGRRFTIDARPSDALALALRTGAEILVDQRVLDKARRIDLRARTEGAGSVDRETLPPGEIPPEFLAELSETVFGKWKM